jgi:hypothetical protein
MSLSDLTDREAVLKAIEEFDRLGQESFLNKYGFGLSKGYWLAYQSRQYDSKAIAGAAHGFQYPDRGPLKADQFSGGETTVKRKLEALGFTVRKTTGRPAAPT